MVLLCVQQLCTIVDEDFGEVLRFAEEQWLPVVDGLHQPGCGVVDNLLLAVVEALKDLPINP